MNSIIASFLDKKRVWFWFWRVRNYFARKLEEPDKFGEKSDRL